MNTNATHLNLLQDFCHHLFGLIFVNNSYFKKLEDLYLVLSNVI